MDLPKCLIDIIYKYYWQLVYSDTTFLIKKKVNIYWNNINDRNWLIDKKIIEHGYSYDWIKIHNICNIEIMYENQRQWLIDFMYYSPEDAERLKKNNLIVVHKHPYSHLEPRNVTTGAWTYTGIK